MRPIFALFSMFRFNYDRLIFVLTYILLLRRSHLINSIIHFSRLFSHTHSHTQIQLDSFKATYTLNILLLGNYYYYCWSIKLNLA